VKVWSDTLTTEDLYAALPADVTIANLRELRSPRKRSRGWEIDLEGHGERHTRRSYDGERYAATWDDHGAWFVALYERDPDALLAWYASRADFYVQTRNQAHWRQRSPFRAVRENSRAPWLAGDAS